MPPVKCLLHKLPAELRLQVFKLFFSTLGSQQVLALLHALRSSSSTAFTIYPEAIQIYHRMYTFTLTSRNEASNMALGSLIHNSILDLEIGFSIIASHSRIMMRTWTPSANPASLLISSSSPKSARLASLRQEFSAPQPVINERIRPLPSYKTISPFANLRILRLDAVAVKIRHFHNLTALIIEAVLKCKKLERVEVRCLDGFFKGGVAANCSCADCADRSGNDGWLGVVNASLGIRAKLMLVPGGEPIVWITEGVSLLSGGDVSVRTLRGTPEGGAVPTGQVMWWFWDRMDGELLKREKKMKTKANI